MCGIKLIHIYLVMLLQQRVLCRVEFDNEYEWWIGKGVQAIVSCVNWLPRISDIPQTRLLTIFVKCVKFRSLYLYEMCQV